MGFRARYQYRPPHHRMESLVRIVTAALAALSVATTVSAQTSPPPPSDLASVELQRSRTCVDVLARLDELDEELAPLAERSRRLVAVAQAVALEDDRVLGALDQSDSIEAQVHEWFVADQALAQRYVATLAPSITTERAEARDAIEKVLTDALTAVQAEADERMATTGDLAAQAGPCDGAIFVRSAVQEACAGRSTRLCDAAAGTAAEGSPFRFVDAPESIWEVSEMRPWTNPTPLRPTANGQLDGARTVAYARNGNVVVTVSFSPMVRDRTSLTPEETQRMTSINDSLGIEFDHPDLTFFPALAVRATLPRPLAGESQYVLHFGTLDAPDVVWAGASGTGAALEGVVPLGAGHVGRLRAGEPIALTAVRSASDGSREAVFSIELTSVNQARASEALFGYMTDGLGRDLAALVRPRGSE